MDDHNHGTHVSGTIAAVGNNGIGVVGVSWNANIMAIKIFNAAGSTTETVIVDAINYATMMGAPIMSNSWGGGADSQLIYDAIQDANDFQLLFVVAAGNNNNDNDSRATYPASYDIPNILAVAATDKNDLRASFSNYGRTSVDLGAPGVEILSTIPGNEYASSSGTSMATPHVSGAAALILQAYPDMSPLEVRQLLEDTAVDLGTAGKDNTYGSGRIDVFKAIFPQVSTITITPDPTNINLTINATINDARHNISYADFYIDADTANATLLTAIDSNFNETSENVTGSIDITNLSDGIYTITIRTNNNLDIWNNQTKTSFTIDTTAPHITLHSLDNDSAIQNGTIIDFTITDLSLANVSYSINSTQQGYSNITNVTLPHPYEINTTDWNESTYVIRIWANDSLGHENSTHYR